ncbi:MAG: hypothetical protein DRP87_16730 [Spirochaetes bacterium]|nr:MAG: hypothetical protein DRP87_16730 [Spirochaetota bacterium]
MARKPRLDSVGFHHVLNRGVEKRIIFIDSSDYNYFFRIIYKNAELYHFKLHAYALMPNHYHLLIETFEENLSSLMQQINATYSIYFNKKYERVGPLWQGRFKSFYVYNNAYLNLVIKYIENNPIKAGLVTDISEIESYPYVSKNVFSLKNARWDENDERKWAEWVDSHFDAYKHREQKDGNREILTDSQSPQLPGKVAPSTTPLAEYFGKRKNGKKKIIDAQIVQACRCGYKQSEIADYLNVTPAIISRRVGRYYEKKELFSKTKQKGLFWSYDKDIQYDPSLDSALIETLLKYGDYSDIKKIFSLYGKRAVKKVWSDKMIDDDRFIKVNYFLARVFSGRI